MPKRSRFVFELALADLRHEWVLTLCMVLALAAGLAALWPGSLAVNAAGAGRLARVAAVSPPLDLSAGADWVDRGGGRVYRAHLLSGLREIHAALARQHAAAIDDLAALLIDRRDGVLACAVRLQSVRAGGCGQTGEVRWFGEIHQDLAGHDQRLGPGP